MPSLNWKVTPQVSDDLITQLLSNRGIVSDKEREQFFNPSLKDFEKDLQITNTKLAQKRIQKAIEGQELIIVYGDYDVDGVCASAILYKGLTSIGAKVLPYIPHREKEGYGLANTGLEFARDSGASLVITVDNGIVAFEPALFAKSLGLDLIITDHHLPLETMPEAYTIIHSTAMCGTAVAWCLIRDIIKPELADELLELVAIATVADMIPLIGLGRAFVKEGLKRLNRTKNPGLLALLDECGVEKGKLTGYELGHIISPRINAIGRLKHAIDALRLICTKDLSKAKKLARLLCDTNLQRQQLTIQAIEEAKLKINTDKKIHIIHSEAWVPGIIGLIAARVSEEYYRPAIAISVGETMAKGSARSVNGINIVEVIRTCSDILIDVGGHTGAAGFSIEPKNIADFTKRIEKVLDDYAVTDEHTLEIEAEIESKKITKSLAKTLDDFDPFGMQNPRPLFASYNMKITDIRTVGQGKHLKFKAEGIDAIAFGMGNWSELLQSGQLINLAYNLEINRFNGAEIVQLKVKDLKLN